MEKGKIIGGLLVAAAVGAAIYVGFVKKAADGTTWIKRQMKRKEEAPTTELQVPTTDPVNKPRPSVKPKEKPKADPIPKAPFAKGDTVMANTDMAIFSQPANETRFMKASANRFDILGIYDSTSSAYPGWSKVFVTKTLKNKGVDVPNKWMGYVKTNMLTQPVR